MIRHAKYANMHKQVTVFDAESFIEEVKLRPAIWDYTTQEYSDLNKRKQCWAEICTLINPDYNDMTQEKKNAISFSLQQRWRNLRQCFKREMAKRNAENSKSARADRKSYIYFDVMSFLTPVVSNKQASPNKEDPTRVESPQEDEDGDVTMSKSVASQSKSSASQQPRKESLEKETMDEGTLEKEMDEETVKDSIRELCDAVEHSISKRQKTEARDAHDGDDDKHFLLSLLSAVKSVPNHMKYVMRAEMMELVAKYSDIYSPLSGNSQYQSVSHNAYPRTHQPQVQVIPNYSSTFTHSPGNLHCQTVTRDAQPSSHIPSSRILPSLISPSHTPSPRIPSPGIPPQRSSKPKLDPETIKKTFDRLVSWSKSQPKCLQTQVLALKASYDYMQR